MPAASITNPRRRNTIQNRDARIVMAAVLTVLAVALASIALTHRKNEFSPITYADEHIIIEGNEDFVSLGSNLSGSGTDQDPYVVRGLHLSFSSASNPCILVANTTAHLFITECRITYTYRPSYQGGDVISGSGTGIRLSHAENVTIMNFVLQSCNALIDNCTNLNLSSNLIMQHSLNLNDCTRTVVMENEFAGVTLRRSSDCTIEGNDAVDGGGIELSACDGCVVGNNTVSGYKGISLTGYTSRCIVTGNKLIQNHGAIYLNGVRNCSIQGNRINQSYDGGIWAAEGWNITIDGNDISNCSMHGISLGSNFWWCNVTRNNVSRCYVGISLYRATYGCHVIHNNIINSSNYEVMDLNEDQNSWDAGYPEGGNYYSNYTGADDFGGVDQDQPGSDGIGDSQYVIHAFPQESSAVDRYPLMKPFSGG